MSPAGGLAYANPRSKALLAAAAGQVCDLRDLWPEAGAHAEFQTPRVSPDPTYLLKIVTPVPQAPMRPSPQGAASGLRREAASG